MPVSAAPNQAVYLDTKPPFYSANFPDVSACISELQ